jgi:hypothetical protein
MKSKLFENIYMYTIDVYLFFLLTICLLSFFFSFFFCCKASYFLQFEIYSNLILTIEHFTIYKQNYIYLNNLLLNFKIQIIIEILTKQIN